MTMKKSWSLPILAVAALLFGTALGAGTLAAWKTTGHASPATIVSGDLDVTAGDPSWTEISSDVKDSGRSIDPATFLVRRGDTLAMTQPFTTRLEGENMIAAVAVNWDDPAALPDGVTATYEVLDSSGKRLGAPTAVGSPLRLDSASERLSTDDTGRSDDFSVRVSLDFAEMGNRFGKDSSVQVADLGRFAITLDQTREGGRP